MHYGDALNARLGLLFTRANGEHDIEGPTEKQVEVRLARHASKISSRTRRVTR